MVFSLTGCGTESSTESTAESSVKSVAESSTEGSSESSAENSTESNAESSEDDSSEDIVVYEAIFLDNDEISELFCSVRGETAPFENVTTDFHITTEFLPEDTHMDWYGETISVHITGYTVQDVEMEDGQMTSNEGFKAEVSSENQKLNEYLESLGKNYHITGAYKDAPKYTGYIDFSDAEPVDFTVTGTFGGYISSGEIDLGE